MSHIISRIIIRCFYGERFCQLLRDYEATYSDFIWKADREEVKRIMNEDHDNIVRDNLLNYIKTVSCIINLDSKKEWASAYDLVDEISQDERNTMETPTRDDRSIALKAWSSEYNLVDRL
jgi:hypothetical protein